MSRFKGGTAAGHQVGSVSLGASLAAGASGNLAVTFPVTYASTPAVQISSNSARVNAAVITKSATGFTINYANWTTASTPSTVTFDWAADPL